MAASVYDVILDTSVQIYKVSGESADSDNQVQIIAGVLLRFFQGFRVYGRIALEHLSAQGEERLQKASHKLFIDPVFVKVPHRTAAASESVHGHFTIGKDCSGDTLCHGTACRCCTMGGRSMGVITIRCCAQMIAQMPAHTKVKITGFTQPPR